MLDILSNLMIEQVYSATTMYTEAGANARRLNRPSWAMVIKYEGETVYQSSGRSIVSNAENPVLLPCGCSYDWLCMKAGHYAIIEFQCNLTCESIISMPVRSSDHLMSAFKSLEHKRMTRYASMEMESIRDLYSMLLELMELTEQAQQTDTPSVLIRKLAPAMEYITQNYNTNLRNDDLARLSGLSTAYFRRLFTEVYGTSPIAYARELRIRKAREMLRSDYASITDVALSLGYPNVYDFSRDFKKHVGLSPTKFAVAETINPPG